MDNFLCDNLNLTYDNWHTQNSTNKVLHQFNATCQPGTGGYYWFLMAAGPYKDKFKSTTQANRYYKVSPIYDNVFEYHLEYIKNITYTVTH